MEKNNLDEIYKRIDDLENETKTLMNAHNKLVKHFHELVGATLQSLKENNEN